MSNCDKKNNGLGFAPVTSEPEMENTNVHSSGVHSEEKVDTNNENKTDDEKSSGMINSMNSLVKQTTNNIKNILNLGQEMPEEVRVSKVTEPKSNKKLPDKNVLTSKCRHKSSSIRRRPTHSKKRNSKCLRKHTSTHAERAYGKQGVRRDHVPDDSVSSSSSDSDIIMKECVETFSNEGGVLESEESENYNKEYGDMYKNVHHDYYETMTKAELAERWIEIEDQIDVLEKHLKAVKERKRFLGLGEVVDVDSEIAKIEIYREEINKKIAENHELYLTNEKLQSLLNNT